MFAHTVALLYGDAALALAEASDQAGADQSQRLSDTAVLAYTSQS